MQAKEETILIIGAGPAGLGAAYELLRNNGKRKLKVILVEKNNIVGGLARTIVKKGARFDVGPHRFYTKNDEILKLWKEILGDEFVQIKRQTRMFYNGVLFAYPVEIKDLIQKISLSELFSIGCSYILAKLIYINTKITTFEDYITSNFGRKLYLMFFKTYTEKVWGVPCDKIDKKWAAQRIKSLNFIEVVLNSLSILESSKKKAKSLVDQFYYPVNGSGYFYEKLSNKIKNIGGNVLLNTLVDKIKISNNKILEVSIQTGNRRSIIKVDYVFSSAPITNFISFLQPSPNKRIIDASNKLKFRDHITVNLKLAGKQPFNDNWIYIHSPKFKMARVTNYNSFSKEMVPSGFACLSVEYFTFEMDSLWKMKNTDLVKFSIDELTRSGLITDQKMVDGFVVREKQSYPIYYLNHEKHFNTVISYVSKLKNLQLIGRGGMFRYNNMDHSIYSGILAARNYLNNSLDIDLYKINDDAEYIEIETK